MRKMTKYDIIEFMDSLSKLSDKEIVNFISKKMAFSGHGWEIGPDLENGNTMTFSISAFGGGDFIDDLESTLELPLFGNGWSVQIGIPPRDWEKYFHYTDFRDRIHEIEGSRWRFDLINQCNQVKIILYPHPEIDPDIFDDVARILCVGELGEKNIIDFVSEIDFLEYTPDNGKPLSHLRKCFLRIFPKCYYKNFLSKEYLNNFD